MGQPVDLAADSDLAAPQVAAQPARERSGVHRTHRADAPRAGRAASARVRAVVVPGAVRDSRQ